MRLINSTGSGSIKFLPAAAGTGNVVSATAFSPNSRLLAASNRQGYVTLWDTATGSRVGAPLRADPAKGSAKGGVLAIAFSPDGKPLAAAGVDGHVTLWHTATGSPARSPIAAAPPRFPADWHGHAGLRGPLRSPLSSRMGSRHCSDPAAGSCDDQKPCGRARAFADGIQKTPPKPAVPGPEPDCVPLLSRLTVTTAANTQGY